VTTGLAQVLDERELESVLAHELAHVANRDAAVMTVVALPRTMGVIFLADENLPGVSALDRLAARAPGTGARHAFDL
jgi:Zn-dependent protease with chaperone function